MDNERLALVLSWGFAYLLAIELGALALAIALGHVTKDESFGLEPVISTLSTLSGVVAGIGLGVKLAKGRKPPEK